MTAVGLILTNVNLVWIDAARSDSSIVFTAVFIIMF